MTTARDLSPVQPNGMEHLPIVPPLRERVYNTLERMIVDGGLAPGFHLIEDDLAERLGVSRNPIREALQRLSHERFVDRRPGRGAFVHSPTLREVDEVFHVRALLESESVRMAAERITAEQLNALQETLRLGHIAVEAKEAGQLLELNERFHDQIIGAADNSVMAGMMVTLRQRIRWYFSSVVVTRAAGSWGQHEEIYSALRDRDAEKAAAWMTEHVMQTRRSIQAKQVDPLT